MPQPTRPLLLWISFLSLMSMGLQGGALGVAWLSMEQSFDKTLEALGVLLAVSTIGGLIVSFYGGRFIAKLGLGWVCLLGSALSAACSLTMALAQQWALVVVVMFFWGIGRAMLNTSINTFVASHYQSRQMNWLHAIFGVGSTLGPLLITFIVADLNLSWRLGYFILTAIEGLVTLLFFITLKDWRLKVRVTETKTTAPTLAQTLRLAPVWLGTLLFVMHTGMQMSTGQLSNNLLVEGRSIDPKTAGIWISMFWGFITIGRLTFGTFIDRLGAGVVLRFCTFGTVIAALLILWNAVPAMSFLGIALAGFTLAPVFPTSVSRIPAMVGTAHSPNAIGVEMAGAALGGALLPGLAGWLSNQYGLSIIPVCLVAIALLQFFVHEALTQQEKRERRKEGREKEEAVSLS
jgi:fucose permease